MPEGQVPNQLVAGRYPDIVVHRPEDIHMYTLTGEILDALAESGLGKSLNALLAATLFGAFMTLIVWFFTGDFNTPIEAAAATGAAIVLPVLFLYFGIRAVGDFTGLSENERCRLWGRNGEPSGIL